MGVAVLLATMANKFVALLQQELPSGLPFVATLADKYFVLSYLSVLPLGRGPAGDQHRPARLRHALALAHQRRGGGRRAALLAQAAALARGTTRMPTTQT